MTTIASTKQLLARQTAAVVQAIAKNFNMLRTDSVSGKGWVLARGKNNFTLQLGESKPRALHTITNFKEIEHILPVLEMTEKLVNKGRDNGTIKKGRPVMASKAKVETKAVSKPRAKKEVEAPQVDA